MSALRFTALVAANPTVAAVAVLLVLFAFGLFVAVCVAAPSRRGRRRASRLKRHQVCYRPDPRPAEIVARSETTTMRVNRHRPDGGDVVSARAQVPVRGGRADEVDFDRLLQLAARPSNRGRFGGRP